MQYAKDRIDFLSGETTIDFNFLPIDNTGEYELMVDVTRHYKSGEKRVARYRSNEFIDDLYNLKRYMIDVNRNSYQKYRIAVDAKYTLQNQIREYEGEIKVSKLKVRRHEYSPLMQELDTVIEAHKINYENVWWRVKVPIIISIVAFGMSLYTFIDNLSQKEKERNQTQTKTEQVAATPSNR